MSGETGARWRVWRRLDAADPPDTGERFETLCRAGHVVVERIVSSARLEPTACVQQHDEWVVLLAGGAHLDVDGAPVTLAPFDALYLPAHTPHRVERADEGTVWLAIHVHLEPR